MRRVLPILVLGALALVPAALAPAQAEEEPAGEGALLSAIFDVHALTRGVPNFIPPTIGLVSPDGVSDEEHPFFGAEGEEPVLPYGTADEIIELLQATVDPVSWEVTEGADLRALGDGALIARARRSVLEGIASRLVELEDEWLLTVATDVAVVRLPPEGDLLVAPGRPLAPDRAAALLGSDALEGWVRVVSLLGQRSVAFHGTQRPYVQDCDVAVAQGSKAADPIVGVASEGLAVDLSAYPGGAPGRVRVSLSATLVRWDSSRVHESDAYRLIEMPEQRIARARSDLVLEAGRWHLADGAVRADGVAPWAFLVRAVPLRRVPRAASVHLLPAWPVPDSGPLAFRSYATSHLAQAPWYRVGREVNLVPSNFTSPEPPELPEPVPVFPTDALAQFLREVAPPRTWSRTGSSVDASRDRLLVWNTGPALDAVERTLGDLRDRLLWTTALTAEVVEVPTPLAFALGDLTPDAPGGGLLDARAKEALQAALAAGDAVVLDRTRVTSLAGARNVVEAGREIAYIQDYEVEIAQEAAIGNPVVQSLFAGTVLDAHPSRLGTGDGLTATVRFTRSELDGPIAKVPTVHGEIDAPVLRLLRVRTDTRLPFGETAVVSASGGAERTRLLLVTAASDAAPR